MMTPNDVIVSRSDLLPVKEQDYGFMLSGGMVFHKNGDPDKLRLNALQLLSAADHLQRVQAEKERQKAKEWVREHAVPLARIMYNEFYSHSDKYHADVDPEVWLKNYEAGNTLAMKWVATAAAVLKAQETDAAE